MTDAYVDGYAFGFGNAVFPPPNPLISSTQIVELIDPVSYQLGLYIQSIIINYINPAFTQAWNAIGNAGSNLINNDGYASIGNVIFNPLNTTLLQSTDIQYPIVCLYREKEQYHQQTSYRIGTISDFVLQYVLPPLDQEQYDALYPFLSYLSKTFLNCFFNGTDRFYTAHCNVLRDAGLAWCKLIGATYPSIAITALTGQQFFPNVVIRFQAFEMREPVDSNYEPFTDIFLSTSIVNDGYGLADAYSMGDAYVSAGVSITSLSASSGVENNWIDCSGTGFLQLIIPNTNNQTIVSSSTVSNYNTNPIYVAGVPVKYVIVRSDKLLSLCLGPSLQSVSGPITLTNLLNNPYTSSIQFTYNI